jgi:hypothetical protein
MRRVLEDGRDHADYADWRFHVPERRRRHDAFRRSEQIGLPSERKSAQQPGAFAESLVAQVRLCRGEKIGDAAGIGGGLLHTRSVDTEGDRSIR